MVLAKVIICPLEFEAFNKHIITDYEIGRNDLLIMGDFFILKWYCLTLNRAEVVYYIYKAHHAIKYLYLINI
jgi:hypothetical protein